MKQGHQRLRRLYSLLAAIPVTRIDLEEWRRNPAAEDVDDRVYVDDEELESDCGTVACAIGWAASFPEFVSEGLYWGLSSPRYGGFSSWEAVQQFFGLTRLDAYALFAEPGNRLNNARQACSEYLDEGLEGTLEEIFASVSHKRIALMRIRNYLLQQEAISSEEHARLAECERKDDWSAA